MIFENLAKIANLGKDKNEKIRMPFFAGNTLFLTPFKGCRKSFFNIFSDLGHKTDQIYHLRKSPLGGP